MEDMMMKTCNHFILLVSALVALGCSRTEIDVPETPNDGRVRFTAILEGAGVSTRTELGAEDEEGMYPVFWSEGDKIKIFVSQHETSDGEGYELSLETGAGTHEGVFSGTVPELPVGSRYYYAVYPYSLAASIGGANYWDSGISAAEEEDPYGEGEHFWHLANYVMIPLPSVQTYSEHSFGRNYNPAIAVSTDETLRFKNVCGVLRIDLTGDVKVGKITIREDGGAALWGHLSARYRWVNKTSTQEFELYTANGETANVDYSEDRKILTLDCGEGVQLTDEPTDFYLVLPVKGSWTWDGGDFYPENFFSPLGSGFTVTVYDVDGKEVYTKHTDADNSIHRSMIRKMPVLDIRRQTFTDLSAQGTANSYIVKPNGGSYRFYAGNRGSTTRSIHDNEAVIQTAFPVILWETNMSLDPTTLHEIIDNVAFDPETKYISFNTTVVPGNALIALKDVNDNVLWSWHIWSTDYDPEASGAVDMYGTAELMNRNLGALQQIPESNESNASLGLYYEWGRKDPFDVRDGGGIGKFTFYPSQPFNYQGQMLESDAILHPTTYARGEEWMKDEVEGRMDDPHWPASFWGKEKTVNDPCPPGWQVADYDAFAQFGNGLSTTSFDYYDEENKPYRRFYPSAPDAIYPWGEAIWTNYHSVQYWGAIATDAAGFQPFTASSEPRHVRCQRSSTIHQEEIIDLSENGTANCYMARPGGRRYKFNASVKGNSDISVGMPASAAIIFYTENSWEDLHGQKYGILRGEDALILDCYLKDGYVYFLTSFDNIYGNATIQVRDIHKQVLWSWHIWIVDYDPEDDYISVVNSGGMDKMMKMNLGALNNTMYESRAMGMMYQWGRKDPFLGARAYDSNSPVQYEPMAEFGVGTEYGGSVAAGAETSTLKYAIRNPGTAINAGDDQDDWLAEPNNALWGPEKTIYDPCPPGWKVPTRPTLSEHTFQCQFQLGMSLDGEWFPATGYRHFRSFSLGGVSTEGHYWYASPKDDGTAYSIYFECDYNTGTLDFVNHADSKAQCNAVRCVKDEPTPGVITPGPGD